MVVVGSATDDDGHGSGRLSSIRRGGFWRFRLGINNGSLLLPRSIILYYNHSISTSYTTSNIMKASMILALLPLAMAMPAFESRQAAYVPCAGTESNAVCCATDVLGLADLDCLTRTYFVTH